MNTYETDVPVMEPEREFAEFAMEPTKRRQAHFDSGVYNGIVKGYAIKALKWAGMDKDTINRVLASLNEAFDEMTASEAEAVWMKW